MINTSGFTFGQHMLIIILIAFVISCNHDEVKVENQNLIGKWRGIEHSDSIDHIERLLIFERDSTYKYEISKFISIPPPEDFPGPLFVLLSIEIFIGQYYVDGRNVSLQADTQINTHLLYERSDTIKIDSFIFEECKFEILDTFLTLRYTNYRANTPIMSTIVFRKIDDDDL